MTSMQSIPKLPAGVKLSDVFHLAADKYLAATNEEYLNDKCKFSCLAIELSLHDIFKGDWRAVLVFMDCFIYPGLKSLGLRPGSTTSFIEMGCRPGRVPNKAQGARYTWLKFCAMLAEEQEAAGASWN